MLTQPPTGAIGDRGAWRSGSSGRAGSDQNWKVRSMSCSRSVLTHFRWWLNDPGKGW